MYKLWLRDTCAFICNKSKVHRLLRLNKCRTGESGHKSGRRWSAGQHCHLNQTHYEISVESEKREYTQNNKEKLKEGKKERN